MSQLQDGDVCGDWRAKLDPRSNKIYYYNTVTKVTTWRQSETSFAGGAAAASGSPTPPLAVSLANIKRRIAGLLARHAPDRIDYADKLLEKYVGKEERLLQALCRQYLVDEAQLAEFDDESGAGGSARSFGLKSRFELLSADGAPRQDELEPP